MSYSIDFQPVIPSAITLALHEVVEGGKSDYLAEILKWLIKSGLNDDDATNLLISSLSKNISHDISHGIVQITIENLDDKMEINTKIEKQLDDFFQHVEIIIKSGVIDLICQTFWFKVSSRVVIYDLKVNLENNRISAIDSGMLNAYITLAYCGLKKENDNPDILFKNEKIFELDLSNVIKFRKDDDNKKN